VGTWGCGAGDGSRQARALETEEPAGTQQNGKVEIVADKRATIEPENSTTRRQPASPGVRGAAGQAANGSTAAGIVQRLQTSPNLVSHVEILTLQRTIGNRAVGQLLRHAGVRPVMPIQRWPVMGAHGVVVQRDPGDPDQPPDADIAPTPSPDPDPGPTSSPDADVGPTAGQDSDAGPAPTQDPDSDGINPPGNGTDPEDQEDAKKWDGERGLTPEELADAQDIYQDSLDFSKVSISGNSALSSGATRTIGNTIYFEDDEFDGNTSVLTPGGRSTLIHELGHVWQYQHGGMEYIPNALGAQAAAYIATGDRSNAYVWRNALNQGLPWAEWNAEQQAEAIQDYHDAKGRIAANQAQPADQQTVQELEPYIGQVRNGLGAPGGPSQAPGDYPEEDPNRRSA
jgi:hypothetical protein